MRGVQLADVEAAARVLILLPQDARLGAMRDLLWQAVIADRYRKRLGRPHRHFGTGTLMSAALQQPLAPRPPRLDADALQAFYIVLSALQERFA